MNSALPLAYASRHIYSSNGNPYGPPTRGRFVARRRRRRSLSLRFSARRLAFFQGRAAAGR